MFFERLHRIFNSNKCFNIVYPHKIHTFGNRTRFAGETGGTAEHISEDTKIDKRRETADDVKLGDKRERRDPDSENNDIDYNPMYLARTRGEIDGSDDLEEEDQVEIDEGPWKYVGGD